MMLSLLRATAVNLEVAAIPQASVMHFDAHDVLQLQVFSPHDAVAVRCAAAVVLEVAAIPLNAAEVHVHT
jgi:hypothetical protein